MSVPDFRALRPRFPMLRERLYCDNQSFGAFPAETLADLDEYRDTLLLRNRAPERWFPRVAELVEMVRRLLGAPLGSIALRDSATSGQAAVAAGIEPIGERRRIVIAPWLDFDSSRFLWTQQARRGFELVEIGREGEALDAEEACAAIDERTSVVALPLVSPRTGALLPISSIAARARQVGAITVLDAYQGLGVVPLDVAQLDVDVVVGGTHKWLLGGGTGLAFLYVAPALAARLPVVYPGWFGHARMLSGDPRFEAQSGAARFQQGSFALEPIYTARAGLRFVLEVGVHELRRRTLALTARMLEAAAAHDLRVTTPTGEAARAAVVCLDVVDPSAIVGRLYNERMDIDARPGAGLRVGPHPCLEPSECEDVIAAIARAVRER